MRIASFMLAILVAVAFQASARSDPPDQAKADPKAAAGKADSAKKETPRPDPFDFSDASKATGGEQEKYLKLDDSIKVSVDPIERSAVVDRVMERSTIYVKAPGSVRVEIYLEPVDSPFCGHSLGEPRLLGQSRDGRRNFPVIWSKAEPHRYVKVYAKAYKPDGMTFGRSRSIDLAMTGQRFQAPQTPTR